MILPITKLAFKQRDGISSFFINPSTKVRDPRSMELGSGRVAGKVLIVDHMLCSAKLLILVDSVTC